MVHGAPSFTVTILVTSQTNIRDEVVNDVPETTELEIMEVTGVFVLSLYYG